MGMANAFMANHLPIPWEASHTRCTTNMGGLTFIFVTHFTPKTEFITFIKKQDKLHLWNMVISPHTLQKVSGWLAWWTYYNHNPSTPKLHLKRTHNTCNLSQRSASHHCQCSAPQAEFNVRPISMPVTICLSLNGLVVYNWAHNTTVFVMIKLSCPRNV